MNPRETGWERLESAYLPLIIEGTIKLFKEKEFYADDSNSMHAQTIEDATTHILKNYGFSREVILQILLREASSKTKDESFIWKMPHICQEDLNDVYLILAVAIVKHEINRLHPDIIEENERRKIQVNIGRSIERSSTEDRILLQFGRKPDIKSEVGLPSKS